MLNKFNFWRQEDLCGQYLSYSRNIIHVIGFQCPDSLHQTADEVLAQAEIGVIVLDILGRRRNR